MTNDQDALPRTPTAWTQSGTAAQGGAPNWDKPVPPPIERFLGGSPAAVFVKLVFVSLIVGALMMWLDLHPADLLRGLTRFINRIWALGFDAIREISDYLIAGAMIVVPVWFILRLLNMRNAR